jgi:hypothetical protein
MRTVKEADLHYLGPYEGPQTCGKIVGRDKYGGKLPCGRRADSVYEVGSGKVYLCNQHQPNPICDAGEKLIDKIREHLS